ncbi:MAG: hypothetical protein KDD64_01275 [Bdellovibrionales bacterium]|nr:hypothetical protein [Bdellovibrionales bacterium]
MEELPGSEATLPLLLPQIFFLSDKLIELILNEVYGVWMSDPSWACHGC